LNYNERQLLTEANVSHQFINYRYGLCRSGFAYILATFPLVFPNTSEGATK
jgi:hypothetical protein